MTSIFVPPARFIIRSWGFRLVENDGEKNVWSISKYYLRGIKLQILNSYIITPLHIG
jgi:hypothetical protein